MALNPRAPVFLFIAFFAINLNASSVKWSFTCNKKKKIQLKLQQLSASTWNQHSSENRETLMAATPGPRLRSYN